MTTARGTEPTRSIAGDLRLDEHALMWLLDLISPVLADPDGRVRQYGVLPRPEAPRYLIPLDAPRTSAALMIRPGNGEALGQRMMRLMLRPALRLGVVPFPRRRVNVPDGRPGSPSLIQWLEHRLDRADLVMAIAIGPPRVNRKPIVQVMTPDGRTVCYAKVAVDGLTGHLLRNESAFLAEHRPQGFVVPALLALDRWKGHEIACISALPLEGRRAAASPLELTPEIVLEIAGLMPLDEGNVLGSPWWTSTRERAAGHDDGTAGRLRTRLDAMQQRLDGVRWRFGAWHGDLTPWNAEWIDGRLHIWDWERTGGPVPVGFDVVHAEFQMAHLGHLGQGRTVADATEQVIAVRGTLLERLGIPISEQRVLVECYQLELCLRLLDATRYGSIGASEPLVDELLATSPTGDTLR